jgi:hypothetical protein
MRFLTPKCDSPLRRFRESLRSARLGCGSIGSQLALPISQLADSSLTVQDRDQRDGTVFRRDPRGWEPLRRLPPATLRVRATCTPPEPMPG